jgi:hypothetical protein
MWQILLPRVGTAHALRNGRRNVMEAVVLAAVLAVSLLVAVAAAWAALSSAMYLLERTAAWTASPAVAPLWAEDARERNVRRQPEPAPIAEHAAQARQPIAA